MNKSDDSAGFILDSEYAISRIVENPRHLFSSAPSWGIRDGFNLGYNLGNSLFSCARDPIAQEARIPGRLWHWFPKTGRFYVGFVLVDNEGSSYSFDFYIQKQKQFSFRTRRGDGLRHIYFTARPLDLQYAQTFEFRFAGDGTPQAVEGLVFCEEPPQKVAASLKMPEVGAVPVQRTEKPLGSLTVRNPAGLPFEHELLRYVLPGGMKEVAGVTLNGKPVPFHVRRIGGGVDANRRLEVVASGGRSPAQRLEIVDGPSPRPAGLACRVTGREAVIRGGLWEWRVRVPVGERCCRLEAVGPAGGQTVEYSPRTGREAACEDFSLSLADSSPLSVELDASCVCRLAGKGGEFLLVSRMKFVLDSPRVEIEQLFENHAPGDFLYADCCGLDFRIPGAAPAAIGKKGNPIPTARFEMFRHTDREVTTSGLPHHILSNSFLLGDIQFTLPDFDRLAPKAVTAAPGQIVAWMLPPAKRVRLDPDPEYRIRNQFFLERGRYKLRAGVSFRQRIVLRLGSGPHDSRAEAVRAERPPYLFAPCFPNCGTLIVDPAFVRKGFAAPVRRWMRQLSDNEKYTRPFSFFSYGDWFGERVNNWGNSEYDTPFGLLTAFLALGDEDLLRRGIAAARHMMDVDTYHGPHPKAGWQIGHSMGHGGHYYPDEYRVGAQSHGGLGVAHNWVEGLLLYHWLTGDGRARVVAVRLLDDLAGPELENWHMGYERDAGWHLTHLCAGYAYLRDPKYLSAAARLTAAILERLRSDGSLRRVLASDHCGCFPKHTGCVGFCVCIAVDGLKRFHILTGDPVVRDAILGMIRFVMADMYDPKSGEFRYTSCPAMPVTPAVKAIKALMLESLAYTARLTDDRKRLAQWGRDYRRLTREVFPRRLVSSHLTYGDAALGKTLSQRLRMLPSVAFDLYG